MLMVDGEEHTKTCVFAHGAGASMDSEFMQRVTEGLVELGIKVVRFEFPYMQERRLNGKKRPPNRQPELIECFASVLAEQSGPCVLMGKSMGGRMASILASEQNEHPKILGVLALGYPFHPQGKPEKLRIDHLPNLSVPMAIAQGTRDALGNRDEVSLLPIPSSIEFLWLEDGDHDLKPRVKSGFTHQQHIDQAIEFCADFIKRCY
jgi:predicted alpha/beta-hydrolase family hydrolase